VKSLAHRPASSVSGHPAAIVRDRRIERTRGALVAAFTALLFERGFSRVTVRDVIARANIGRSTFYEHFENKHDLLEQSLAPVLTPLADVLRTGSADAQLREILDHIWSNRRLTAPMLTGSRALVTRSLVRLFEERLEERRTRASPTARRVAAAVLAGALLAFFEAWFSDEAPAKPDVVAPRWPV
jgi:AcrR family transcriptional regulator